MKTTEKIKHLIYQEIETENFEINSDSQTLNTVTLLLNNLLPQPEEFAVIPCFPRLDPDSAIDCSILVLILDTSYQEADYDFETPLVQALNNIGTTDEDIKVTASNPADGIILLTFAIPA